MHTNVWYELALLELSGDDPSRERLREAEAVQMASMQPDVTEPEAAEPAAAPPHWTAQDEDWTC